MYKDGVLTINYDTWKDGIASSPFAGVSDMRNIDPYSKPGALLCGFQPTEESSSTFSNFVRFASYDAANDRLYAGADDGTFYVRASGTWSEVQITEVAVSEASECHGLTFWKNHVLFAEDNTLHVYDIDNPFWFNDWQTFAEGKRNTIDLPHVMLVGQDDVVYITDGKYIASVQEQAGQTFDPNSSGTYTFNSTALDLPDGYVASSLGEVGTYLVIGTYFGEVLNRGNRADIFPWDRISQSYNIPLRTSGNGVWQMHTQQNQVFSMVDRATGQIYASNLTQYELQRELENIEGLSGRNLTLHPDAVDAKGNELLFGVGGSTSNLSDLGIYSYKNGRLVLSNTLSAGDSDIEIGSINVLNDTDVVATWKSNTTYGADLISTTRATGFTARMDSPFYRIGTPLKTRQFNNLDIHLGKELADGQAVKILYRENTSDTFTELVTFDFATYGAVSKANETPNISDISNIQLQVQLTCAASSTDTPELISVELY